MARVGDRRGAYRVLFGRPEGTRPLGRIRWEDNIKKDLKDVGGIDLVQDRNRWWAVVNAVMNLRVS
jgi:hypothetical protein